MNVVILAAGQGKRMRSTLPKVLHPLAGQALLDHVVKQAFNTQASRIVVVVGHGGAQVQAHLEKQFSDSCHSGHLCFAYQTEQKGTGHALIQALPHLDTTQPTLVLYGDVPLTQAQTLSALSCAAEHGMAILTVNMAHPTGYGRIVRHPDGHVIAIVEQKDATEAQKAIREVNTGIMVLPTIHLETWLKALRNDNAQGEFYLTDVVAQAVNAGIEVKTTQPSAEWETLGVNSKVQLAELERIYQFTQATALLEAGVMLLDPHRFDLRGSLHCGAEVSIDVGCVFEGEVTLGDGVSIGPYCVIKNATIQAGTHIEAFTHIDQATVGADSKIGPYARLRPGTVLGEAVHIGNFTEVKNSQFGQGSKANHLAYVGDATVGARVNIGAGTITCNYDGANKFRTVIEDDAFIGSDTQLVAPVTVGAGATLGAGTTLTKNAPAGQLTVSRPKQISIATWQRPVKVKK
jgi:bifunctional UDP-N-acetylglucosamine pyrophosphorylase / glucosamine-1-phosphate N-acetyltransferase